MYVVTLRFSGVDCRRHFQRNSRAKCSGKCYRAVFGEFEQFDDALAWTEKIHGQESPRRPGVLVTDSEISMVESTSAVWHV
jgi:hypothetical protein